MHSGFTHFSSALPSLVITKDDERFVGMKRSCHRSGVEQRHCLARDETITDIACAALQQLHQVLGARYAPMTALVVSTTQKATLPETQEVAEQIAKFFSIPVAIGVNYACSGFARAVEQALSLRNKHSHIGIVCTEAPTMAIDWEDSTTAPLFGDGAVAASICEEGRHRILHASSEVLEDPHHFMGTEVRDVKNIDGSRSKRSVFVMKKTESTPGISENAPNLVEVAGQAFADLVKNAIPAFGKPNIIIPHQPSGPVLRAFESALRGVSDASIIHEYAKTGNMASVSTPFAISQHLLACKERDLIFSPTVGAGPFLETGKMTKGMVIFEKGSLLDE